MLDMESDIWNAIQPGGSYFLLPCIRRELPVSDPVGITRKSLLYKDFQIGVYLIIKKILDLEPTPGIKL